MNGTLILLLAACAPQEVVIVASQPGCDDYDFDAPPAESLQSSQVDGAVEVRHVGVIASCDAVFDPDLSSDGSVISVNELWTGDDPSSDCSVCWAPTVTLQDPPRGRYDFRWTEGDVPFDTLSVTVD